MKTGIHPEYMETKVVCNSCNTKFTSHSTVPAITVEICSNCHPFYTGKQKLIDTAGRVDKFNARRDQAAKLQKEAAGKVKKDRTKDLEEPAEIQAIAEELADETVDLPKDEIPTTES